MKPARTIPLIFLLTTALLAGCISGDDAPVDDSDDDEPQSQEGLGTVSGTVLTIHLEPIESSHVALVQDDEEVVSTETDANGDYVIRNVEPGQYRLHVTAIFCCKEHVGVIQVKADEVTNEDIQLEVYSDDDMERPRVEQFEWRGFLACTARWPNPEGPHHGEDVMGIPLGVTGANACGLVDIVGEISGLGNLTDDDFLRTFTVQPGLKTVLGAMEWQAPGASMGDQLTLYLEVEGRPNQAPRYASATGHAPLEFRVDAGYVEENYEEEDDDGTNIHQYDFNNLNGPQDLMYRVFAGGDANLVYQQQFTVYWELHYWHPADEDRSALPDG